MHDASEAYVNDLCTPIKHSPQMKWYRDVEQGVQAAIGEHFQIDWKDHAFHIKAADNIMLATEARDLMGSIFLPDDTGLMPERIIPMSQQMAKQEFLRRFNELRGL
jgi:5'-deoxynucleotidase YfbR-like HD superfamily hydrolase